MSQPFGEPPGEQIPVLREILAHKRAELVVAKARTGEDALRALAAAQEPPRNLFAAVTRPTTPRHTAVIAEIKRKSPSGGLLRPEYEGDGFRPEDIARRYHQAGAAAISCLTDEHFFGGHTDHIARIKAAVPLPVLRKDFLIDPWQLWESRAAGADGVLLIAECLREGPMIDMMILAQQLGMTMLVEVHDADNLLRVARHVGFPHPAFTLLGVNNRDLRTMRVDLGHTLRLAGLLEDTRLLVSESGIASPEDLARLRRAGVRIALVGEHLMRQPDPGLALQRLLNGGGS